MAERYTPIANISGGKKDLKLLVRVPHMWFITDKDHPDEIIFMNLLLVDEKGGKIHASVRKSLVSMIKEMVQEGSTYKLENVLVGFNDGAYKLTAHKHKITMMGNSKFTKVDATNIPKNVFDFMSFKDVLSSVQEEKVIDIIGHVIEKDAIRENDKNGRKSKVMDLTLEDLENNKMHCSLWGEFAEMMDRYFATHNQNDNVVLILQFCKTRKYMGAMGVANAFFGTKLILNGDLPEVNSYKERMKGDDVQMTQGVSQMTSQSAVKIADELLNTKLMTIEDLIESNQACHGSVLATICEIETGVEWYFRSCTECASLVTVNDGVLCCRKCGDCKSAVPRYKLHLIVMDSTGSTTFVLFDRVVTQFIGRNVQDLIDSFGQGQANKENDYPPEFNMFIDKQVLFKVEVSDGNVKKKFRNYAVKKASDDVSIIEQFMTKHNLKGEVDSDAVECNSVMNEDAVTKDQIELEGGDSCNTINLVETPVSKVGTKRLTESLDSVETLGDDIGQASTTKPVKMVRVKIEPKE